MTVSSALIWSAILQAAMVLVAGVLKYEVWSLRGILVMMSNREAVPPPSALAGRADRAAWNMVEGLAIFTALAVAVSLTGHETRLVESGAAVFFFARLIYWPVYLAGVIYVRSAIWIVSMVGLGMIAVSLL